MPELVSINIQMKIHLKVLDNATILFLTQVQVKDKKTISIYFSFVRYVTEKLHNLYHTENAVVILNPQGSLMNNHMLSC